MNSYFFFICLVLATVVLNTIAQTLLKLGTEYNLINVYLFWGILTYGISTLVYLLALSRLNLSLIYPVVIGLTIVATTFSSTVFLKEQVPTVHWIGIGLIISGISAISATK